VEVAPGGTGDEQVSGPKGRRGLQIALGVLALLLLAGAVVGGVYVVRERQDREQATADQDRYGDVLAAARKEIEAFVNVDYRDAQKSIDAVKAGATGDFAKEYDSSTKDVVAILTRAKSVMDGEVLWAGVVDADQDSATVIVATTGTVSNTQTDNKPVARQFRIKVDLVREDGEWKTSNVEFVG
jgi:Mce-associated membrane protein